MSRILRAAAGVGVLALLATTAAAEMRRVEAVGAVPAGADAPPGVPVRQAALEAALREAVLRVAAELVGQPAESVDPALQGAVGERPLDYVTRYRLVEDRGEGRALLIDDPEVTTEYVVLVEAHVDAQRLRERLVAEGFLAPAAGGGETLRFVLVLEEVGSYRALAAVRERLSSDPAVRSVVPEELTRGRVWLAVETTGIPSAVLGDLVADPPEGVDLVPLGSMGEGFHVRLVERPLPEAEDRALPGAAAGSEPAAGEIDTLGRNRY